MPLSKNKTLPPLIEAAEKAIDRFVTYWTAAEGQHTVLRLVNSAVVRAFMQLSGIDVHLTCRK